MREQQPEENAKVRNTVRRKICLSLLSDRPMLLTELKWRTWSAEWRSGKTKFVCSKSAYYNRSFKRSIGLWEQQGVVASAPLKSPITYGMAAKLAVFTALERGQLSAPDPENMIRLYFDNQWCSIVVAGNDNLAVNLGAVFTGSPDRYQVISEGRESGMADEIGLSKVGWTIRLSSGGKSVDPFEVLSPPKIKSRGQYSYYQDTDELFASEGVALSMRHSTPGRIGPYMLTGEQLQAAKPFPLMSPR